MSGPLCPLDAEPDPEMVFCPHGCGYGTPARFGWRMQVHLLVAACRNRPKVAG